MAVSAHAQASAQSLIYAVYDSPTGAMNAFQSMQQAQQQQVIRMQSYAVISKDANGKVHVQRSNQKTGTIGGVVIGGLIGALGGPAGVAAGAAAGGITGRAAGEALGIPTHDIKAIKDRLEPNTSALLAVVDEQWASDVSRSLHQTEARSVLQSKIEQSQVGTGSAPSSPQPDTQPQPQPQL